MKLLGFMLIVLACSLTITNRVAAQCSIVSLNSLSKIEQGTPIEITAQVPATVATSRLTFKWRISIGTITSGDNTSSITIDTADLGGQRLTVSVEVTGATTTCTNTGEISVDVLPPPPTIEKFDEYGDIKFEDEKARLDNLAIAITRADKSYFANLFAYAGRRTYRNEASERLARAKNYLVKVRGIDPNRIITTDLGHDDEFRMVLQILPGGMSPLNSGTIQLPLDQLDFSKPRPRQSKRRH
jgi:hypothetical protein